MRSLLSIFHIKTEIETIKYMSQRDRFEEQSLKLLFAQLVFLQVRFFGFLRFPKSKSLDNFQMRVKGQILKVRKDVVYLKAEAIIHTLILKIRLIVYDFIVRSFV